MLLAKSWANISKTPSGWFSAPLLTKVQAFNFFVPKKISFSFLQAWHGDNSFDSIDTASERRGGPPSP